MRRLLWALCLIPVLAVTAEAQQSVFVSGGTRVTALADVSVTSSATLVNALDTTRVNLNCTNTSSSVHIRWGDSTVTSTKGQQIPAGTAVEISNVGDVYMISEGATVTVACTKETR